MAWSPAASSIRALIAAGETHSGVDELFEDELLEDVRTRLAAASSEGGVSNLDDDERAVLGCDARREPPELLDDELLDDEL